MAAPQFSAEAQPFVPRGAEAAADEGSPPTSPAAAGPAGFNAGAQPFVPAPAKGRRNRGFPMGQGATMDEHQYAQWVDFALGSVNTSAMPPLRSQPDQPGRRRTHDLAIGHSAAPTRRSARRAARMEAEVAAQQQQQQQQQPGSAGETPEKTTTVVERPASVAQKLRHVDDQDLPRVQTVTGPRLFKGEHEPEEKVVAIIEFKRGRLKKLEAPMGAEIGSWVITESDRGVDCGLVVQTATYNWQGYVTVQELEGSDSISWRLSLDPGVVTRKATEEEINALHTYVPLLEQQALNLFRMRCKAHGINPNIPEDCEFQFDGRRITFYYDAEADVEFRDVTRDLAMTFNARIWVDNTNPHAQTSRSGNPRIPTSHVAAVPRPMESGPPATAAA